MGFRRSVGLVCKLSGLRFKVTGFGIRLGFRLYRHIGIEQMARPYRA